ncbi:MAG: hypothetical protein PWR03_870 [Tenuifilum sp.]|nr:hypothetical protein [Tenuifilum sp.]
MHMKKITIYRPQESFNKYCSYKILARNSVLTELKNGERKIIEIPDELENKTLKAKMQWCGSGEIELNKLTENETIKVSGNEFFNRTLISVDAIFPILGLSYTMKNQNELLKYVGIGVLILLLIGLIGTITIWKDKWLKVEKS